MKEHKLAGAYFRERRLSLGLSMLEMARRLGHDSNIKVSRWERGLDFPEESDFKNIISAYQISSDEWESIIEQESIELINCWR